MKAGRFSRFALAFFCLVALPYATFAQAAPASTQQLSGAEVAALPSAPVPNLPQEQTTPQSQTKDQQTEPAQPSLQDLGISSSQTKGNAKEQALLDKRTHMLKVHQTLGLNTTIPMVAALVTDPQAKGKGRNGQTIKEPTQANLDFHMALGSLTTGLHFTTAYYAMFAPKLP